MKSRENPCFVKYGFPRLPDGIGIPTFDLLNAFNKWSRTHSKKRTGCNSRKGRAKTERPDE